MADVGMSVAGKLAEFLGHPIWRQISYPFKYKTNMEEMKKQLQKLKNKKEMVQHSVEEAERQGEVREKFVEDWMKSVDEFDDRVVQPINNAEERAAGNLCFTMRIRYSLSRKAAKATKDGIELWKSGIFEKVSYLPDIQRSNSVLTRGFEDFDSRKSVFDNIMAALKDEDVNSIGVYGMGGVGKTTLVKKVAAQAKADGLFGRVIFVEVGQTVDVEKLQKKIAEELGMKLRNECVKATQIYERLKTGTSILIILDNIWEKLDLDEVGIPFWNDVKTKITQKIEPTEKIIRNQKSKLLLTSRDQDVLCNDMNTEKNFLVATLSDLEALDFFWKTINRVEEETDFDPIAIAITRKCAGLPIAITTIASALKNKDLSIWNDALTRLEKSDSKSIRGMEKNVHSTIELSYKFLGPVEQSLFLLCALDNSVYGSHTDYLLKYSMGLNLFGYIGTIEEAKNRMHTVISNLKSSCLLLDGHDKSWAKMHDIIHAVGVSIASSDEKLMFNIPSGSIIREMLENKLPKDSTMVTYKNGDIRELPKVLEFPNLKFFHLNPKKLHSSQIPDTLFENAKELKVLDLTKFDLPYLPSSLGELTNLQTLCLDQCIIGNVAIIGELKKLEFLSFSYSELEQLPSEIGQCTRLRILDLRNCLKLKIIAPNVLSCLMRLEELYIGNFIQWDVDGRQNASPAELKKLSNLTTLEIQVREADIIAPDLFFGKLKNYKIFIGDVWKWSRKYESSTSRILKLKLNNSFDMCDGIKFLLKEVENLHLDEPKGVKNVLQTLNEEGFQRLKHLHIHNAPQIQYISSKSVGWGLCSILPHKLESLVLQNLIHLEMICRDQLAAESFGQLKVIKIEKCDKLKHLILPIAGHLSQLEKIKVSQCSKLEDIVFVGGRELHNDLKQNSRIDFKELHSVKLQWLPHLAKFGFITSKDDPDSFKSFFGQNVLLPKLEKLVLCSIPVKRCLFSLSMVRSLRRLKKLVISKCEMVEAIFDTEESMGEETSMEMIFPILRFLNLDRLPKLTRFCLDPLLDKKVSLSSLIVLGMHSINPTVMWHNQLPDKSFYLHNLVDLSISGLDDLKYLFTSSMINSLPQLDYLCIKNCKVLEVVVVTEDNGPSALNFSNLNELQFHNLPKLTRFSDFNGNLIDLSLLSKIRITNCPEMKMLISHSHCTNMPPRMGCTEMDTEENFQDNAKSFFDEKVKLSSLKELKLEQMGNVRKIWQNQLYPDSFSILEILHVRGWHKISSVFPSNMLGRLQNLHELQVIDCDSTEEIFEPEAHSGNETHDIAAHQLEKLLLKGLPKLKHIWNMNSQVILSFQNLQNMRVELCNSLRSLFPAIVAKSLEQLEMLYVHTCMMEEIIAMEDEVEALSEFVFPRLRSFELYDLPNLVAFYSGSCKIEFPSLQEVIVRKCPNMKRFSRSELRTPKLHTLQIGENEGRFESDLNTSIEQQYMAQISG